MCFAVSVVCESNIVFAKMTSKETPKKTYRSLNLSIDSSSCRLCRAVGDTSRRKNIFKPTNRALLKLISYVDHVSAGLIMPLSLER